MRHKNNMKNIFDLTQPPGSNELFAAKIRSQLEGEQGVQTYKVRNPFYAITAACVAIMLVAAGAVFAFGGEDPVAITPGRSDTSAVTAEPERPVFRGENGWYGSEPCPYCDNGVIIRNMTDGNRSRRTNFCSAKCGNGDRDNEPIMLTDANGNSAMFELEDIILDSQNNTVEILFRFCSTVPILYEFIVNPHDFSAMYDGTDSRRVRHLENITSLDAEGNLSVKGEFYRDVDDILSIWIFDDGEFRREFWVNGYEGEDFVPDETAWERSYPELVGYDFCADHWVDNDVSLAISQVHLPINERSVYPFTLERFQYKQGVVTFEFGIGDMEWYKSEGEKLWGFNEFATIVSFGGRKTSHYVSEDLIAEKTPIEFIECLQTGEVRIIVTYIISEKDRQEASIGLEYAIVNGKKFVLVRG